MQCLFNLFLNFHLNFQGSFDINVNQGQSGILCALIILPLMNAHTECLKKDVPQAIKINIFNHCDAFTSFFKPNQILSFHNWRFNCVFLYFA